jgi:hypothetical protein
VQHMSRRAHGWSGPGSAEEVEWRDGPTCSFKLWWSNSVLPGHKFQSPGLSGRKFQSHLGVRGGYSNTPIATRYGIVG